MPSCLAYLSVALPSSTLGLLWPSMRLSCGARDINWMHASYGLGATIGPLIVTVLLTDGLGWRRTYGLMALVQTALACVFIVGRRGWRESPRAPVSRAGEAKPGPDKGTARRKPPVAWPLARRAWPSRRTGR